MLNTRYEQTIEELLAIPEIRNGGSRPREIMLTLGKLIGEGSFGRARDEVTYSGRFKDEVISLVIFAMKDDSSRMKQWGAKGLSDFILCPLPYSSSHHDEVLPTIRRMVNQVTAHSPLPILTSTAISIAHSIGMGREELRLRVKLRLNCLDTKSPQTKTFLERVMERAKPLLTSLRGLLR